MKKIDRPGRHWVRFLTGMLLISLVLTACGGRTGQGNDGRIPAEKRGTESKLEFHGIGEKDLVGMTRVCLYVSENRDSFASDQKIIKERVNILSGGRYAFGLTTVELIGADGKETEKSYPAVEFYLPCEAIPNDSVSDIVRFLISRPVKLWIGKGDGTGRNQGYEETLPVEREDIVSAKVLEGCPPGIHPFDYGIDVDSFPYVEIVLSDRYTQDHPEIRGWKTPGFLHDTGNDNGYFHIGAVPAGDGKTFYLMSFVDDKEDDPEENRGIAETLVYDYTHEPLSQAFYILDIPGIIWEEADGSTHQINIDEFDTPSQVITYEMEESACREEDWERTGQVIKERLEAMGTAYAVGRADREGNMIALRVENRSALDDLMPSFVTDNPSIMLSALGKTIRIQDGEAVANVVKKDGRYVLELDMSERKKDTLNKLTGITRTKNDERLILSVGDFPLLWTDYHALIRDGKITFDFFALTGEKGVEEKDTYLLNMAAAIINGSNLPVSAYGSRLVNLKKKDYACLDAEGRFYLTYDSTLDYSGYYGKLKELAESLGPDRSGPATNPYGRGPGGYILVFPLPEGEDRAKVISKKTAEAVSAFWDDVFTVGAMLDFIGKNEEHIRVSCGISYQNSGKIYINVFGYEKITQEDLELIRTAIREEKSLQGKIFID